jgi:hypothetical protein
MTTFNFFLPSTSTMAQSTHDARIELAIADLLRQTKPNYMRTARKYEINRTTLRSRFLGNQLSKKAAASEYRQRLTFAQEEALISLINTLEDRGLPPTSRMVRNLAEEMINRDVGKNWTGDFLKRYKGRLKGIYLRNIDSQRVKAEYAPMFQRFYDLVSYYSTLIKESRSILDTKQLTFILVNQRHREI